MKKGLLSIFTLILPILTFAQESTSKISMDERIEAWFKPVSDVVSSIVFYPISMVGRDVPIVIIILLLGALYFTIYNRFANFRLLGVAIRATRGKYDEIDHHVAETVAGDSTPNDDGDSFETIQKEDVIGEVTHFQALTAALSATVGLGNIAGVSVAIAVGGPGATIWMILAGLLGMSSKLVEATLGVKYREVGEDGKIYGGPMYYLTKGLKEKGLGVLGKILAVFFAIMVVGGSFGGGNMFQANQAAAQFKILANTTSGSAGFWFGVVLAALVGLVIIGGIKRIGKVTEKVVPFMAIIFVGASLVIIFMNFSLIPDAVLEIWDGAFKADSALGGIIGVMIVGFQRAAFSNEAGVGSASIAHAAVKTRFPASEGIVASIGPFIDTVVICTMTALVIIIVNLKNSLFAYGDVVSKEVLLNSNGERIGGVDLTSLAFETAIPNFSIVLTVAVILFAFSSMLSWSYYGLQGWTYLFGRGKFADIVFKSLFLIMAVVGASSSLGSVIDFSDAMIFAMVFPNIIGLLILAPKVKKEIKRYLIAIGHTKKE
jgi:AGCS family alanine or glycine:cation symporter